jgi:hypothetical protein
MKILILTQEDLTVEGREVRLCELREKHFLPQLGQLIVSAEVVLFCGATVNGVVKNRFGDIGDRAAVRQVALRSRQELERAIEMQALFRPRPGYKGRVLRSFNESVDRHLKGIQRREQKPKKD